MEEVFIGFGSNEGDSLRICREAIDALGCQPGIRVERVSSLYRTKPVGPQDQPWFVNGVIQVRTSLAPEELLGVTAAIEKRFGRERKEHWGPRTLDLDILLYGDLEVALPGLTIPHPRLQERLFVLIPLVELNPDRQLPLLMKTARELLVELEAKNEDQEVRRVGEV